MACAPCIDMLPCGSGKAKSGVLVGTSDKGPSAVDEWTGGVGDR